jgi:hypothetical protein
VTGQATLRDRVEALAAEAPLARRSEAAGVVTWSVGTTAFAVLSGEAVELRLDRPVAHAATRTPDTAPSHRGEEWVRFAPMELDGHAIDRLEAWFALARRRAAESKPAN